MAQALEQDAFPDHAGGSKDDRFDFHEVSAGRDGRRRRSRNLRRAQNTPVVRETLRSSRLRVIFYQFLVATFLSAPPDTTIGVPLFALPLAACAPRGSRPRSRQSMQLVNSGASRSSDRAQIALKKGDEVGEGAPRGMIVRRIRRKPILLREGGVRSFSEAVTRIRVAILAHLETYRKLVLKPLEFLPCGRMASARLRSASICAPPDVSRSRAFAMSLSLTFS